MGGDTGGFSTLREFLTSLSAGHWDQRYNALLRSGDGNGTGLQIPTQFARQLFDMSLEDEVVRPRATNYPMTSDARTIAGFTVGTTAGEPFGIAGCWTAAGAEIDQTNAKTRAMTLHAHGLKTLTEIANETVSDGEGGEGPSVDQQLGTLQAKGIGWHLDNAFLRGTGAGQPLGILNSSCLITVPKETGQAADTVEYDNLVKMFARLHPAHIKNAVWVCNPSVIPQLLTMGHVVGLAGAPVPVLREDGTGGWTILTRPAIFSEKMSAVGDVGDILVADLTQYAVGLRAEIRLEKSQHVGFTRDTSHYRTVVRADGMPTWDTFYTPAHGDTLSPFVTLAARA